MLPSVATPTDIVANAQGSSTPTGFTPSQIRNAYGFNLSNYAGDSATGQGQTIAIIDAYNDPNIQSDLTAFDNQFSLLNPPSFSIVNQNGGSTLPSTGPANWTEEISLDVEWAHALAPQANILLVEANSNNDSDLFQAVSYAADQPGVSVVSMSWGGPEFSGETSSDSVFTTPSGHQGVTFVESTGDNGAPGNWVSPNVVAVGGTTLTIDQNNNYVSETGWSDSGGGISQYESKPSYQSQVTQSSTQRTTPDVAFDADPNTGVAVYDSLDFGGSTPWNTFGGTSFSAPAWGALIATADQVRADKGEGSLDGPSQTLSLLYSMPTSAFHDITSGSNGYSAGPGYDLVTGLGSPIANQIVNGLVTFRSPTLPFSDNFAATSDGQLSTNWLDEVGDFTVNNSNQAVASSAPLDLAVLNGVSQANVKVSASVSIPSGGGGVNLLARYSGQGDNNYYLASIGNTGSSYTAYIYKNVNGTLTELASQTLTSAQFNGSGTMEFDVVGWALRLFVNGNLVTSAIDNSLTSGSVGMRSSAGVTFSSFSANTLTVPTLPFTDNFGTPGQLSTNWLDEVGDFTVNNSNQAVASSAPLSLAVLNGVSQANVKVSATVSIPSSGGGVNLLARYSGQGDSNYYLASIGSTGSSYTAYIYKNVNGTLTELASQTLTSAQFNGSGTMEFDAIGPSLRFFVNGSLVTFANDTSLTTGSVGMRSTSGVTYANFSASAVTLGTPPLPFSDNFAATSDGQLSTNWLDEVGDFTVNNSNQAVAGSAPLDLAVLNGVSQANVKVSATVNISNAGVNLLARYSGQGDNNYYLASISNTGSSYTAYIYKNVNGTLTELASQTLTSAQFNGSGTMEFDAIGPSLRFFVNGSLVAFANDTSLTTGSVGMRSTSGVTYANFSASAVTLGTPSLPFNDNFAATSDGQLSTNWLDEVGDFTVNNSNQAVASNAPLSLAVLNGVSQANVKVSATVSIPSSGGGANLLARYSGQGDNNYYLASIGSTGSSYTAYIYKNVNGTLTELASQTLTSAQFNGSGTMEFDAIGSSLQLYVNGSLITSANDTSLTTGSVGIRSTSGVTYANFSVSD